MGCQPARLRTEPESSSDDRKSWEMKGLQSGAAPGSGTGFAQESQAAGMTSAMALTTRRVISADVMEGDGVLRIKDHKAQACGVPLVACADRCLLCGQRKDAAELGRKPLTWILVYTTIAAWRIHDAV